MEKKKSLNNILSSILCCIVLTCYHLTLKVFTKKEWIYVCVLVAQLVKNPPAMLETPVGFLDWRDPLGKG